MTFGLCSHLESRTTYFDPRLNSVHIKGSPPIAMDADDVFKQRFDASSTADEVLAGIDLKGQTYLVTGGTSGVGKNSYRKLYFRVCDKARSFHYSGMAAFATGAGIFRPFLNGAVRFSDASYQRSLLWM